MSANRELMKFFSNDPFGAHRYIASQIVEHMLEAWTPERQAEIEQRIKQERNAVLIEHVKLDDYDLTLWHYLTHNLYAVSLNSGQEDPTDLLCQKRAPKAQHLKWSKVEEQLRFWIDKYGKLLIGSTLTKRTEKYRLILRRNFLIGEWDAHPNAGFFILPD